MSGRWSFVRPNPSNRVPQGVRGTALASAAPTNKPMPQHTDNFAERWNVIANPGAEHTEQAFTDFIRGCGRGRKVLNCAVPLARAQALTDFQMPAGLTAGDCITSSVTGNFPDSLRDWKYQPKFCSERQATPCRTSLCTTMRTGPCCCPAASGLSRVTARLALTPPWTRHCNGVGTGPRGIRRRYLPAPGCGHPR